MYIVITEKEVIISKLEYQSFREIQNDFYNLVTALGPWSVEETIQYLEIEYPELSSTARKQVEELVRSAQFEVELNGLSK